MSSLGRNGSQNPAQNRPINDNRAPVSCRLCDQVLYSTHALISHIESHIHQGHITPIATNQHIQPTLRPNHRFSVQNPNRSPRFEPGSSVLPLRVNPPTPSQPGPTNLGGRGRDLSHSQLPLSRVTPIAEQPRRADDVAVLGQPTWSSVEDVVSPVNGTRPILSQMDRPIPKVVDQEMESQDGLDLTLKL